MLKNKLEFIAAINSYRLTKLDEIRKRRWGGLTHKLRMKYRNLKVWKYGNRLYKIKRRTTLALMMQPI